MRARIISKIIIATVLAMVAASPAFAQTTTTGQIQGTVLDAQAAAVPGATVTATSPQLQASRSTVTDGSGTYRFATLPPGLYSVKATLTGFQPAEQGSVQVSLDQTATVNLKLVVGGVSTTVNVVGTGAAPVDTTSAAGGISASGEMFSQLAGRRDFYAISRLAPGVNEDAVGPASLGSTGAENQYIIEGLNMTGIVAGEKAKTINFDFIQEVNVKTQGMNAEYGRSTGAIIQAITKSGGNAFHGDLFGFGTGKGLTAKNSTASKLPQTSTQVTDVTSQYDTGLALGGYLVKDKLWFFGAYDGIKETDKSTIIRAIPNAPGAPDVGAVIPVAITRQTFAGKLTANLGHNQTLVGSLNGDPTKRDGAIFAIAGPASTWQGTTDTGGIDGIVRYDGTFANTWLVEATYGRHNEKTNIGGLGTTMAQGQDQTQTVVALSGGFGFYQNTVLHRDEAKLDLTKFAAGHTLKTGIDFEHLDSTVNSFQGGLGQRIYKRKTSAGVIYYRHRYYINDLAPGYLRSDPSTFQIANPLTSQPVDKNYAWFGQDSWKVRSNLTVDAGVRWERQQLFGRDLSTVALELKNNWAGRLGVIFDPMNDGKSKLFAHYGRFYENIPMDINIRSFGGELYCFCYNFSPDPANTRPDPTAPAKTSVNGGATPADPQLKGQYIDEILFGMEREVGNGVVIAARYNYRTLGRVIEDFLVPATGSYFVANPAEGTLGTSLGFYDGGSAPAPKARRVNHSVELSARKRFSNNYQLFASYVWSKLEGNYDGVFQNSTGQLDPNINSAFDYADFLVNASGRLTNDRPHQLKFDGSYQFSHGPADGLALGLSTRILSGTPLTAYGYSIGYANWEYYLTPRGALGRGPATYEADVHAGYPVKFGNGKSLNLVADIFNLFNRQAITVLDQRYNLDSDPTCAGIPAAICTSGGGLLTKPGTLTPVAQLSGTNGATNPDFLKAGRGFTGPFSIRFGARLTF